VGPWNPIRNICPIFLNINRATNGELLAGFNVHAIATSISIFHDMIRLCLHCGSAKAKANGDGIKGGRVGNAHHVADCVTKLESAHSSSRLDCLCGRDKVSEGRCTRLIFLNNVG
jgi:hypothetical protein